MLTIIYGDAENCIFNTSVYFKNSYESEWLETDLAKISSLTYGLKMEMKLYIL